MAPRWPLLRSESKDVVTAPTVSLEVKELFGVTPAGVAPLASSVGSYFGSLVPAATGIPGKPWTYDRQIREGVLRVPAVYRSVHAISLHQARRRFGIRKVGPHSNEELTDHPLLSLLNAAGGNMSANPLEDSVFFRRRVSMIWKLSPRGGFIEVLPSNGGQPGRLTLLPTQRTWPEPDTKGGIKRFRVDPLRAGDQPRYLTPDKVIWFRNPHPEDPWAGMTPLEAAGLSAEMSYFARLYNRQIMANDGRPGGIVAVTDKTSNLPADSKELDRVERKFGGGPVDAGRIVVLDGTVQYVDTAASPRDLQWAQTLSSADEDVYTAFGIPKSIAVSATDSTFTNSGQDALNWWDGDQGAHCDEFARIFTPWVPDGYEAFLDLSDVPCIAERNAANLVAAQAEVRAGLRTPLSYAQLAGMKIGAAPGEFPDVPATRSLWLPAGFIPVSANDADQLAVDKLSPLGTAPQAAPLQEGSADGAGDSDSGYGDDGGYGYDDSGYPTGEAKRLAVGDRRGLPRGASSRPALKALPGGRRREPADDEAEEDRAAATAEVALRSALTGVWTKLVTAAAAPATKASGDPDGSDPDAWWQNAAAASLPALWPAVVAGATPVPLPHVDVSSSNDDDTPTEAADPPDAYGPPNAGETALTLAVAYVALHPSGDDPARTAVLTRALAEAVAWVAGSAWDRGKDLAAIPQTPSTATGPTGLAEFATDLAPWLARVAATAAQQAVEAGKTAALNALGDSVTRTWRTRGDDRVRPGHAAADGQQVLGPKPFDVDGEWLRFPRDPQGSPGNVVNCRCRTSWSLTRTKHVIDYALEHKALAAARTILSGAPTSAVPKRILREAAQLSAAADEATTGTKSLKGFDPAKHPRGFHGRFGHGTGERRTNPVRAALEHRGGVDTSEGITPPSARRHRGNAARYHTTARVPNAHLTAVATAQTVLPENRDDIGKSPRTIDDFDPLMRARRAHRNAIADLQKAQARHDKHQADPEGGADHPMRALYDRDVRESLQDAKDGVERTANRVTAAEQQARDYYAERLGTLEWDVHPRGTAPGETARAQLAAVLTTGDAIAAEIERRAAPQVKALAKLRREHDAAMKVMVAASEVEKRAKEAWIEANLSRFSSHGGAVVAWHEMGKRGEIPQVTREHEARVAYTMLAVDLPAAKMRAAEARVNATLDVLGEIRPFGGDLDLHAGYPGDEGGLDTQGQIDDWNERMGMASALYPKEWVEKSNARGTITAIPPKIDPKSGRPRGFYRDAGSDGMLALSPGTTVAMHEVMHRMESSVPGLEALEWAFALHRVVEYPADGTADDGISAPTVALKNRVMPLPGYESSERGREDKYPVAYSGKEYGGTPTSHWELLTTSMESVFGDKEYADPEMRAFLLGALALI